MDQDLEALLLLQEKDLAVRGVEKELADLEPELERLDNELGEVESQLKAARAELNDAGETRRELEGKIEGYRLMQDRKRQKLEWVRGAKEASAIMAELDLARSVMAREEAEWIRSADRVQEAEARVAEIELAFEETKATQTPRREEITSMQAECAARLKVAKRERDKAKKSVSQPPLSRYERTLQGNAPKVLFELRGSACGNCFTTVPMHLRHLIEHNRSIVDCQGCGVMLYALPE